MRDEFDEVETIDRNPKSWVAWKREAERLQGIIDGMALAAMDSEPAPESEKLALENLRSAMEGIGHIRRTLEETFGGLHGTHVEPDVLAECKAICDAIYAAYRHAQPAPVVPDDVMDALQKVARIRLDMNDFDGDRRGIADCLCDAEEALIEVVNRRAAMLAAAPHDTHALNSVQSVDSVADRWIPVSERMPENDGAYLCWDNRYVTTCAFIFGAWQANQFIAKNITHWMPLPAGPQEVNHG